ncbi:3-keto-5-aminohexanoate cleavage protein [Marimonas arenosa]|uniref:3-keto-5-aminohexanoate cleavage protein n=1 Tax=Marimonas arenosa TaxID=1795305 RepID=A0AAE4B6C5_9RHOB|nr:3-keto-5-aminohexanoate cleavage protein [Marimonas arenosa]MDQ2090231.1 3-keto-5-aminohexanoate cleavage protein [Marimonas arenosa]
MRDRLMVSPTGARWQKADHPRLPVTVTEIAQEARACFDAGAGALHLHIRDADGRHSLDPGRYGEAMAAVAEAVPEMAIQITTESAGVYGINAQAACLREVAPGWASVALREMAVDLKIAARVYGEAAERGTRVQHILYAPGDVDRLFAWQRAGVVPPGRLEAIFVLGAYGGPPARSADLDAFLVRAATVALDWMVCAFGRQEQDCLVAGLARGGRARVGFENNLWQPDGRLLESNAQSVAMLVQGAWAEPAMEG